jgi:predicted DCC family thiol-disulfide oxidoreductase YuxK
MMPIDMARDATEWAVLYDLDCGFCRWSLALLLRADRDRRLRPVAIQSPEGETLLADLTDEQRLRSWHLVAPDGSRHSAGAGAPPLLRLLPGGRPLAAALAAAPGPTERAYGWVVAHRSGLSRLIPARSKRSADALVAARSSR